MAVGAKQPAAARPATASAATKPTPVVVSAKKRKGRRYAKKKPKVPSAQPAAVTATNVQPTTAQKPAAARSVAKDAPSDTWRRIAIDPDLVSMREVETEGEGSGLIALEEISGRAFKGRVQVFTAEDVRAAAADDEKQGAQKGGGRRQKRKRGELVPRLDAMDEAKKEVTAEESKSSLDGEADEQLNQQTDTTVKEEADDEAGTERKATAAGEEEADDEVDDAGVEFDMTALDGDEDEETKAATREAQRILGLMRDERDEEDDEQADAAFEDTENLQVKEEQEEAGEEEEDDKLPPPDLTAPPPPTPWDDFNLHPLLLHALHSLSFPMPTPVQSACLPPALLQRRDIIAAAETGSGKTLTFALPILNGLLLSPPAADEAGAAALVLVPTRELALQVAMHVRAAARHIDWLKCCVLVGGLSQQKQLRQLASRPHVLIATPGRLCELIAAGELAGWAALRYLVLDEADRMVERGLGAEVQKAMQAIDRQRDKTREQGGRVAKLQHFFFSATLSLPDTGRENLKLKKQSKRRRQSEAEEEEAQGMVGYFHSLCASMAGSKPHVVDLTTKRRLVGGLSEYVVPCVTSDKDHYVYALLLQQPADTKLVLFVNAISCLRRLASLLSLLQLPVFPLHAEMQQRQRLKNLDRFSAASTSAILLCTDVAARGLDLPHVPLVVHYQLPGSADVYIHRVGRTARAGRVGASVALVSEEDGRAWHRINAVVRGGGEQEVERYKVDDRLMGVSRARMSVARKLDRLLNHARQHKHSSDWLQRQAAEMDMIVDDELLQPSGGGAKRQKRTASEDADETEKEEVARLQKELGALLKRKVEEDKQHARFYTLNVVEQLEQREEEQKKRLAEAQQAEKQQKKPAAKPAAAPAVKPAATKSAQTQKAKVEVADEGEQKEEAVDTSAATQPALKVEEEHAQPNDALAATAEQAAVQQPTKPLAPPTASKRQSKGKQHVHSAPAKASAATNGLAQPAQTASASKAHTAAPSVAHVQSDVAKPIAAVRGDAMAPQAESATEHVAAKKEAEQSDATVEPAAANAGETAGEGQKLSKRAKKNQRKQKQKLAAASAQQPLVEPASD